MIEALQGPGVYLLVMTLAQERELAIGRRRKARFPQGVYLYVGSAHGPGGLQARLRRHCRPEKLLHWHVDYLRCHAELGAIWALPTGRRVECEWAAAAMQLPGASVPMARFGASDCRCETHLVHLAVWPDRELFAELAGVLPADIQLVRCDEL